MSLRQLIREALEEGGCGSVSHADPEGRIMGHGGGARMARGHLFQMASKAQSLHDRLQDEDELPEWVQSKLAVAEAMLDAVEDHLEYKMHRHAMGDHQ